MSRVTLSGPAPWVCVAALVVVVVVMVVAVVWSLWAAHLRG